MSEYLKLFKALPVKQRTNSFSTNYIEHGVLVEDSVVLAYGKSKIDEFVKQLVPTDSQINKTFHKSWKKVRDASIEQLVAEQLIHYFTTYGLESLGLYNEDTVYLPNEQLELEGTGGVTFYVLRGITPDEVAKSVQRIISSGMALSDDDLNSLVAVIKDQKLSPDPSTSNNREMAVRLYDMLNITPENPVEYLRLQVYHATESTLLIKSSDAIKAIKGAGIINNVFERYEKAHGLAGLASIFYRFKPLFLAFKNPLSASTVNSIRRLAVKHHKPMPEDYLASVTKNLRNGTLDIDKLRASLTKANVFRKVKLAQALRFYENKSASGVVYSVRNGKSFTTTMKPIGDATEATMAVMESMAENLKHLRGKQVYMDVGLVVPTSGKMFCGDIPFGSYFSTKDSLVVGVCWKDTPGQRVDLDLSMVSITGKTGWDGSYRNENFLFSGDITSAPNGATEAFLIRANAKDGTYLLNLNYYNGYGEDNEVPFTSFVTEENEYKRMDNNAMVSQDNMLFWAESTIDAKRKQKSIGVLKIKDGVKTFHVFESKMGNSISAYNDDKSANMISFYDKYLESLVDMRSLLKWVGAEIVSDPKEADIDLSMRSLTKDTLIELLTDEG